MLAIIILIYYIDANPRKLFLISTFMVVGCLDGGREVGCLVGCLDDGILVDVGCLVGGLEVGRLVGCLDVGFRVGLKVVGNLDGSLVGLSDCAFKLGLELGRQIAPYKLNKKVYIVSNAQVLNVVKLSQMKI